MISHLVLVAHEPLGETNRICAFSNFTNGFYCLHYGLSIRQFPYRHLLSLSPLRCLARTIVRGWHLISAASSASGTWPRRFRTGVRSIGWLPGLWIYSKENAIIFCKWMPSGIFALFLYKSFSSQLKIFYPFGSANFRDIISIFYFHR